MCLGLSLDIFEATICRTSSLHRHLASDVGPMTHHIIVIHTSALFSLLFTHSSNCDQRLSYHSDLLAQTTNSNAIGVYTATFYSITTL
jgi:hypothetical protein